jgi:hypothetical protein
VFQNPSGNSACDASANAAHSRRKQHGTPFRVCRLAMICHVFAFPEAGRTSVNQLRSDSERLINI